MTPLTAQARYEYAWRRTHRPLRRFRREGTVRAYWWTQEDSRWWAN